MDNKDFALVSKEYFLGMQKMLEEIVSENGVTNYKAVEKIVSLHRSMEPSVVERECEKKYFTLDWNNIHQLLQREIQSSCQDNEQSNSK